MVFKATAKRKQVITNLFILIVLCCSSVQAAEAAAEVRTTVQAEHFAIVNGETITLNEFQSAIRAGIRKRFYHGKVPPEELAAFKQEVSQTLIDRVLLLSEAKRQKIVADAEFVDKQLELYERRYENQAFWKEHRTQMLAGLKASLEEESMLAKLEEKTKNVGLPSSEDANQFYLDSKELFTTPKRMRVSLIMLKVSPSSTGGVWEAAMQEADQIIERLKNGANFAQLARIHSGDDSASKGGDMGFIHEGMLAAPAQNALNDLNEGEISAPIMLLQGIAILRLDERQQATLNPFEQVAERAAKLLQRQTAENSWSQLLEKLRNSASIKINAAALKVGNEV